MQVGRLDRLRKFFPTDAGFDLIAAEDVRIEPHTTKEVRIGTEIVIPEGHVGIVCCRGSARARGLICFSIFDPFYSGEYKPLVTNTTTEPAFIKKGERVVQLVVVPLSNVTPLAGETESRGKGELGSTGS